MLAIACAAKELGAQISDSRAATGRQLSGALLVSQAQ